MSSVMWLHVTIRDYSQQRNGSCRSSLVRFAEPADEQSATPRSTGGYPIPLTRIRSGNLSHPSLPKEIIPAILHVRGSMRDRRSPMPESGAQKNVQKSINPVPGVHASALLSSSLRRSDAFSRILELIAETIDQYSLCRLNGERIIVALSGGKDSLILARALRELGYNAQPITIDMGYENGWAERVSKLARPFDLAPEIIYARRLIGGDPVTLQIRQRINILDMIPRVGSSNVTPCTYCYSVKVLALEDAARRHKSTKVAFAHHMIDAVASLLKEGLIYIDRWDFGHLAYDRANFAALVGQLAAETDGSSHRLRENSLLGRIVDRVEIGKLDTDEPPRQPLNEGGSSIEIIRPLFSVDERLINQAKCELQLLTADSGCGHGATQNTQTPREMIHLRVLQKAHPGHLALMKTLVLKGVDQAGNGKVRARRRRAEFVGPAYKPPTNNQDKI